MTKRRKYLQEEWQKRLANGDPSVRVHLLGIGGSGLSAIATVLLEMGIQVSGSDRTLNASTAALESLGAKVFDGQRAENLRELAPEARPDVVLYSSAIDASNVEREAAEELGLPVVKRDDFLPALLARRSVIAVAGTHGKSTTTAMIVKVLREAGIDAGYIIGANLPGYGSGSAGTSPYFVIEADEYDRMFLGLQPTAAVITNVEWDHPDCFPTPSSFRRAFMQFVDLVPRDGMVISCADDTGAQQVRAYSYSRGPNWITYGLDSDADLRAIGVRAIPGSGTVADLTWWNAPTGSMNLAVPGLHNVRNALAALAVASWIGIRFDMAIPSLENFGGTSRRFELKGDVAGIHVIDDYAHHPSEIEATLGAARRRFPESRIWAVFQPHTYSRTSHMLYRMGDSFEQADRVIVTDIYAAREVNDGSVSSAELVAASSHPSIIHIGAIVDAAAYLLEHLEAGDVLITLGAGDGYRIGELVLHHLGERHPSSPSVLVGQSIDRS
jgi:UDP-N-acetylmuramate--alanine ligase